MNSLNVGNIPNDLEGTPCSKLLPEPGRAWRLAWVTDFLLANFEADAALDK
jgi:hypothetical protein